MWQAVCIALFAEAAGAILLGAETADTIKGRIINPTLFAANPELLMQGFMCALVSSSSWLMFATYLGWPVSTTHSIIGAVAGIGVSAFGTPAVDWTFKGMGQIIASWFISPVIAGLVASTIFLITKFGILHRKDSLKAGIYAIPYYFGLAIGIMVFYVILKNGKFKVISISVDFTTGAYKVSGDWGLTLSIVGGVMAAVIILCYVFVVPFFKRLLVEEEDLRWYHVFYIFALPKQPKNPNISLLLISQFTPDDIEKTTTGEDTEELVVEKSDIGSAAVVTENDSNKERSAIDTFRAIGQKLKSLLYNSLFMDVATVQGRKAAEAHQIAIKYDSKTEYLYSFLQVATATFASFGHGSNDLANAVGPLAAVYNIWVNAKVTSNTGIPIWILVYGAIGLDLGLALYGYNVMKNLGNNITYHSPSRGFSMEFGAALTVITASFLGLPISTTHAIFGATVGVGLCNGSLKSINWAMFAWIMFGAIVTVPLTGTFAGCLYAFTTRGASFSYLK